MISLFISINFKKKSSSFIFQIHLYIVQLFFFSSPEPKAQMSFSDQNLQSVAVIVINLNFSWFSSSPQPVGHFLLEKRNLLFTNNKLKFSETYHMNTQGLRFYTIQVKCRLHASHSRAGNQNDTIFISLSHLVRIL